MRCYFLDLFGFFIGKYAIAIIDGDSNVCKQA